MEEWRAVPGYPLFEVSSLKRVRSISRDIPFYRNGKYQVRPLQGKVLKMKHDNYRQNKYYKLAFESTK